MPNNRTVAFTCGGSSGHINPALAIAQAFVKRCPEVRVIFVGRPEGLEAELVPKAGFEYFTIDAKPFPRKLNRELFESWKALRDGGKKAETLIQREGVAVVVGTGGYVTGPMMRAAKKLGVPRILHEQNAFPGQSNRVMSKDATVLLAFAATAPYFKRASRIEVTGNPVRETFFHMDKDEARERLGIAPHTRLILVTGGSQGAMSLNEVIIALAKELNRRPTSVPYRIVLAAGDRHVARVRELIEDLSDRITTSGYLYNMQDYMSAADLVVCRAGASTCAELAALGKASILIPYPFATGDHQMYNARSMADEGAAIVRQDSRLDAKWLRGQLDALFERPEDIRRMSEAAKKLAFPDAADHAARIIRETLEQSTKEPRDA